MIVSTVNGDLLRCLFISGARNLEQNRTYVDSLNVFPVPDGDTGTNMSMTMQGAIKELSAVPAGASVSAVMDAVALGALKSARGNSGVILSQLFRGFSASLKGEDTFTASEFAKALSNGSAKAYKAVMRPKEGTILTVSRKISEACEEKSTADPDLTFNDLMNVVLLSGQEALNQTPELLPVLKEAGVVDSGGMGLLCVYRGFVSALNGEELPLMTEEAETMPASEPQTSEEGADFSNFRTEDIEFGYCSEFFIIHLKDDFNDDMYEEIRDHYSKIGDSLVLARGDDFIKVHVHSNCPGEVLQFALQYGELHRLKIENMREQNREILASRKEAEKEYAIIAVSAGVGIDEVFRSIGVESIISGGQTMNPSIDTIVNAVNSCNARNVFVLPNNSNIILAAQQAKELCKCSVIVLPTKTIPQGISAAMAFNPDDSAENNQSAMEEAIENVVSGAVTYAIRDTCFNGSHIHEGDIIGLMDNEIVSVKDSVNGTMLDLIHQMVEKIGVDDPIINLYQGETVNSESAEELVEILQNEFPDCEFILTPGEQPLYYYYLSAE